MTNEEVFQRAHEEFALRGLSPNTADEYIRALRLFLRYYENPSIETMGEAEIRDFLLYQISLGKATGSVNICNSALRFIFGAVLQRNLNLRMIPRRRLHRELPSMCYGIIQPKATERMLFGCFFSCLCSDNSLFIMCS